jgi:hypothetical protein
MCTVQGFMFCGLYPRVLGAEIQISTMPGCCPEAAEADDLIAKIGRLCTHAGRAQAAMHS